MHLCEAFWLEDYCKKKDLCANLLPVLCMEALQNSGALAEQYISRLFAVRTSLPTLDYADPSTSSFSRLLSKAVSSPNFIGSNAGSKFLTYLLTFDPTLLQTLHSAVKVQIPEAGKNQLRSYGEMYLRAWKISSDVNRASLVDLALSPLASASLHVEGGAMAKNLRLLLSPLHEARKDPAVDGMLHALYSPILWRALSAANPKVRASSAGILADTFPLHDPTASPEAKAAVVKKGVAALSSLMLDPSPQVRVAGSEAVSLVLQVLWDTLAPKDVRSLLNTLTTKLSSDASSPSVRSSSLLSLSLILENSSSHPVMKSLLPLTSNLIHDHNVGVRLAMVKMLNKVKTVRGIKFYQIVKVREGGRREGGIEGCVGRVVGKGGSVFKSNDNPTLF